MPYKQLKYLPNKITDAENIEAGFKLAFSSNESKEDKGVVYFFFSENPIPRTSGESRILYIGKTEHSLHTRHYRNSKRMSSGRSGDFYKYIVKNYGQISIGYFKSENPREDEAEQFKKYIKSHLEYPPKSKLG